MGSRDATRVVRWAARCSVCSAAPASGLLGSLLDKPLRSALEISWERLRFRRKYLFALRLKASDSRVLFSNACLLRWTHGAAIQGRYVARASVWSVSTSHIGQSLPRAGDICACLDRNAPNFFSHFLLTFHKFSILLGDSRK